MNEKKRIKKDAKKSDKIRKKFVKRFQEEYIPKLYYKLVYCEGFNIESAITRICMDCSIYLTKDEILEAFRKMRDRDSLKHAIPKLWKRKKGVRNNK